MLAALAATVAIAPALAQVTQITTGAVEIRGFYARATNNIYAAAYGGGLHKSTDGAGASWTRQALPGNVRYLTGVAGSTAVVVIAADEGLLRSTDGTNFTQTLFEPVSAVAVGPGASTTVLAAIKGAGIFRSTDSGASFTLAGVSAFGSTDITAIAFDPSNPSTVYATAKPNGLGAGGGVYRSADGGATWSAYNLNLPADQQYLQAVTVDSAGRPYIGVLRPDNQGDVYYRNDAQNGWVASGDVYGGVASLHRDANTGTVIWAGGRGFGLYSGSSGTFNYTYSPVASTNLLFTGINAVVSLPSGSAVVLQALRGAGVWRSTVAASPRTWSRLSFPGADRVLSAGNVGNSATAMLAGLHAGGLWRSNDAVTWSAPNAAGSDFDFGGTVLPWVSIWDIGASATNANLAYAATGGVGMFYSNDASGIFRWNGAQWQAVNETGMGLNNPAQPYGVQPNNNDTLVYAGFLTPNVRVRSGAGTWSAVATPGAPADVRRVVLSHTNASKVLALLFDDKPAISTNGGASFSQVSVSQTGFERIRFFSAAEAHSAGNPWVAATNKGLFRSTDGGASWNRVAMNGVFQNLAVTAVGSKGSNQRLFAADMAGNRYCSSNGGANWVSAGAALRAGVNAIETWGGNLYYLTDGGGIFREDGTC